MFTQIDIEKFGAFEGFNWRRSVRDAGNNVANFKRLNILYGRNYSGKTTLSRIFRSMQEGALPWNHEDSEFIVRGDSFQASATSLTTHRQDVRVYNRDFVAENLSILTNHRDGKIETFAIVGDDNNRIIEELREINDQLGSAESKSGARFAAHRARSALSIAQGRLRKESDALDDKLRKHANEKIKKDRVIGQAVYNIDHIRLDIDYLRINGVTALSEKDKATMRDLLKQDELPSIPTEISFPSKLATIRPQAELLLARVVKPTKPLDDLLSNAALQAWVKEGIRHHKGVRHTCSFCRQGLPVDLWETLANHFNTDSEALSSELDACIRDVRMELATAERLPEFQQSQFYASEHEMLGAATAALGESIKTYADDLRALETALDARRTSLFDVVKAPIPSFERATAQVAIDAMAQVIATNNARSSTLGRDKDSARLALRRDNVLEFITAIDLVTLEAAIASLRSEVENARKEEQHATRGEQALVERIRSLESQLKDERKGAERINELLTHFFGHDTLRLDTVDGGHETGVRFQLMRGGKTAYHLSEGECSLIAFCYFMAKLESQDSHGKELTIYIDDPISSLDGNHIYFTFSLIESLIARPDKNSDGSNKFRYKQLFISTHNLDFLKYLKRLSAPTDKQGGTEHFIVERHGEHSSRLSLMPRYLKNYVTEFNYLFHQVYKCSLPPQTGDDEEHFFSFGNNIRKFLEAYLYFKYPVSTEDAASRVKRFFGDDRVAASLAVRMSNELSHLEECFDRSVKPIDIPEIRALAAYVLNKIKEADESQYNSLLASIGVDP